MFKNKIEWTMDLSSLLRVVLCIINNSTTYLCMFQLSYLKVCDIKNLFPLNVRYPLIFCVL